MRLSRRIVGLAHTQRYTHTHTRTHTHTHTQPHEDTEVHRARVKDLRAMYTVCVFVCVYTFGVTFQQKKNKVEEEGAG